MSTELHRWRKAATTDEEAVADLQSEVDSLRDR